MTDLLDLLPYDDQKLSKEEEDVINSLFKNSSSIATIIDQIKDVICIGIIYFLLSVESVDIFINNMLPYTTTSHLAHNIVKMGIFMLLIFIYNRTSLKS